MLSQLQRNEIYLVKNLFKIFWLRNTCTARSAITRVNKGKPLMLLEKLASISAEIADAVRKNLVLISFSSNHQYQQSLSQANYIVFVNERFENKAGNIKHLKRTLNIDRWSEYPYNINSKIRNQMHYVGKLVISILLYVSVTPNLTADTFQSSFSMLMKKSGRLLLINIWRLQIVYAIF